VEGWLLPTTTTAASTPPISHHTFATPLPTADLISAYQLHTVHRLNANRMPQNALPAVALTARSNMYCAYAHTACYIPRLHAAHASAPRASLAFCVPSAAPAGDALCTARVLPRGWQHAARGRRNVQRAAPRAAVRAWFYNYPPHLPKLRHSATCPHGASWGAPCPVGHGRSGLAGGHLTMPLPHASWYIPLYAAALEPCVTNSARPVRASSSAATINPTTPPPPSARTHSLPPAVHVYAFTCIAPIRSAT